MNDKNTQYLLTKYGELYRQHSLPMSQTCMCWLFSCSDGWFNILDKASDQLTEYAKEKKVTIEASQVKEKFGTLRIYLDYNDDVTDWITQWAEHESVRICECCGKPGKLLKPWGWLKVRCPGCAWKELIAHLPWWKKVLYNMIPRRFLK